MLLRPNRGAVVASPSIDEARQILFARRTVERAITELATDNATAERLAELREMVVQEQSSFARGDRGRRHPPVRRVPPEARRDGAQRSSGEFPAQPGVADLADHRPVRKRRSLRTVSFDEHNEILDAIEKGDKSAR